MIGIGIAIGSKCKTFPVGYPTGLTLTGISGGVKIDWNDASGGTAETEIWGKSDSGAYALITTIPAGTITYNDVIAPVDLRYYKVRAKDGTRYSEFTTESSIALLGAELVGNPTFTAIGWWTCNGNVAITGGKAVFTGATIADTVMYNGIAIMTTGKTYRGMFTVSDLATPFTTGIIMKYGGANGAYKTTDGVHTEYVVALNGGDIGTGTIAIWPSAVSTTCKVDDVSVKEVLYP